MARRFLAIVVFSLLLTLSLPVTAGPLGRSSSASAAVIGTPLPLTCAGNPAPTACLYGYVYFESVPVSGVGVSIESVNGTRVVTTTNGFQSTEPYFQASLSSAPLLVSVGDLITLTTTYSGSTASNVYRAVTGGQQVDLVIQWSTLFGNGSDGPLTISSNTTESPVDSAASGTMGTYTLSATNASFGPGQVILIHQTQGPGAGTWMRNQITSYSAGTITLADALNASYTSGAQVRVLKQYTNVVIDSNMTYSAKAWNGTVGGILAFLAKGTVTIAGTINASGLGFRGGTTSNGNGQKNSGEGTVGPSVAQKTANGNGGGGATITNQVGSGGGGGHLNAGSPGSATWPAEGGDGGLGGVGTADLTSAVFGGGGGAAGRDIETGFSAGANGGGWVLVVGKTQNIYGSITVNGSNSNDAADSTGGGGAAGSILLQAQSAALGSNLVTALAGVAGSGAAGIPGGNGSIGRIHLDYFTSFSGSTNPAASIDPLNCQSSLIPIATINSIVPQTATQGEDTLVFYGQAVSPDLCGTAIAAYVWYADVVPGVLSGQSTFTRTAASLPVGTYPIYFKARYSNNVWSEEISRTITIQAAMTATPTKTPTRTPTATATRTATPTQVTPGAPASLHLPMVVRSFGSFEIEPNNSLALANGPLTSGLDYHGYQNDVSDYFKFLAIAGSISADLTNPSAAGAQLQLYYQSTSNLVGFAGGAPYHIDYTGAAGWYYVRVIAGAPFNSVSPYTLRVTYP